MNQVAENWPFLDEESGCEILETRFYGFSDSGGIAGGFQGYTNREDAINAIRNEYELMECQIGTDAADLGGYAVTVLSGREFVDQLYWLCEGNRNQLTDFGRWSNGLVQCVSGCGSAGSQHCDPHSTAENSNK